LAVVQAIGGPRASARSRFRRSVIRENRAAPAQGDSTAAMIAPR
jgi:hypothetical protein